ASAAGRRPLPMPPSYAWRLKLLATRASLPGAGKGWMVTITVAMLESSAPSLALKVKVSVPVSPGFGVWVIAPEEASVMAAAPLEPFEKIDNVSDDHVG